MIQPKEKLALYLIFKSNQGTGDHLKNEIDVNNFLPYTSGTLQGVVIKKPIVTKGGHVFFSIIVDNVKINCAVYKPTRITDVAKELIVGDILKVGGGIRKATKTHPRILNLEFIQIIKLKKKYKKPNDKEKKALKALTKALDSCSDEIKPEEIQTLIYSTGKENGYEENLRDWFKLIYEVVFGDENGPRMGFFISFFGVSETKQLINDKIK